MEIRYCSWKNFYKPFFGESRNLSPDLLCKVCKVSARGSHRRESIYRKSITGSKRYILILLTACNVYRCKVEEHVTDQPRKRRLYISPGGARGPGDLCLARTVAGRRRGGGARTVCKLAYFASLHTVARG